MKLEDFWQGVEINGFNECWPWRRGGMGNVQSGKLYDYGSLRLDGRSRLAHRVAWELTHGPIPRGKLVRHGCDNPRCCNPAHLAVGTHLDNTRDAMNRHRFKYKLRPNEHPTLLMMVRRGDTLATIGKRLGISRHNVTRIMKLYGEKRVSRRIKIDAGARAEIVRRALGGEKHASIADDFGVTRARIGQIARAAESAT